MDSRLARFDCDHGELEDYAEREATDRHAGPHYGRPEERSSIEVASNLGSRRLRRDFHYTEGHHMHRNFLNWRHHSLEEHVHRAAHDHILMPG